jgi:hypothetical protein
MNNLINPEDFKPLQYRISKKLLEKDVSRKMISILQNSFTDVLSEESIMLSKIEQKYLFKNILIEVLIDIQNKAKIM